LVLATTSCYGSRLSKASAAGALWAVQNPRALDLHDFEEKLSVRIFGIVQYRWFRRRFKAVGTPLTLVRDLPSAGNVVRNGELAREVVSISLEDLILVT
jgi:hypothetical protein